MWDPNGNELKTLTGHSGAIKAVSTSANGGVAVSIDVTSGVFAWRLPQGEVIFSLPDKAFDGVAVAPDGTFTLLVEKEIAKIWNLSNGEFEHDVTPHEGRITCVSVSSDGRSTALAFSKKILVC